MEDIYLDSNATTAVLPEARAAALAAMAEVFGNPSSVHGSGLKARALMEQVRASARRVLGAPRGQLCFTSGATESIQTAVVSALSELRRRRDAGDARPLQLLYGATEHKAVPEALKHWNALLGLHLPLRSIPVDHQGRHDLAWLRQQAPQAGLVCTMAANNETGVVSDLDGIGAALADSPALWLVDSVQALGKLPLKLAEHRIDYAPFSGHKLYAPKGIGMLYVREGAPFTPLMIGGGQESALRAGTENMAGIAALGAVLQALENGHPFQHHAALVAHRERLALALSEAFPGLVFNAPTELCLPTTLNFAVPGLSAKLLLDLFDAAGLRVSGGSACSAAKAQPSYVLEAMGLPAWQAAGAVRLSFGPADNADLIERACTRIRACGSALRASGLADDGPATKTPGLLTRFGVDGACCYLVADAASRRCVVIDPLPELNERITQWLRRHGHTVVAVLTTTPALDVGASPRWPQDTDHLQVGSHRITRLALSGEPANACAYLLHEADQTPFAFVGDAVVPGVPSEALSRLAQAAGPRTWLLPRHDDGRFVWTLDQPPTAVPAAVGLTADQLAQRLPATTAPLLVDVREPYEQVLGGAPELGLAVAPQTKAVPLSDMLNALPIWRALAADTPVLFYCRSGNRSTQAARFLRQLGHANAWSLEGGLALWPQPRATAVTSP